MEMFSALLALCEESLVDPLTKGSDVEFWMISLVLDYMYLLSCSSGVDSDLRSHDSHVDGSVQ